jgi:cytochrome c oxidase cbb3-type subunit 3
MRKNKYLLLVSSIGVLILLLVAAVQENFLKDWRRIQAKAHGDEGAIPVQLRQVVNSNLGVADRCVSCHVAMAPGESGVRGDVVLAAHKPVVHDPAEYGCTVCHAGQGQATEKVDAHGDVHFWPEPMLPRRFSFAGCGRCHSALGIPEKNQLIKAESAFERLDCRSCHRVDGRGGTVRPDGGGMEGPDLSRTGITGYDSDWHDKHVGKMQSAPEAAWKISFAFVDEPDRKLLDTYLRTRVAAPQLVRAKSAFHASGCLGCHKVSGVGGDDGPDLSRAGDKDPGQASFAAVPGKASVDNWLAEHFRAPASVVVGSQMPPVNLPNAEIDELTMYTLSLRRRELRDLYLPKDRVRAVKFGEREFAGDGATLYSAFCAGCHGRDGMGKRLPGLVSFPSIANPDFLSLVPDDFLIRTISDGRAGRRMPGWAKDGGLRAAEVRAIVGHLRTLGGDTEMRPDSQASRWVQADAAHGKRVFESACAGCHGMNGQGGEGPALNNEVLLETATDTYLFETIGRGRRGTVMAGFFEPSPVRPALSRGDIEAVIAYLRSLQGGKKV